MRSFYEVIAFDILPALRAILANELMRTYGLNQVEISQKLGLTQPAISQYRRGLRGNGVRKIKSNKAVMDMVKKLSAEIATGNIPRIEVTDKINEICEEFRKDLNLFPK